MERNELIRKGNELFNKVRTSWNYEDLKEATRCFAAAQYQDGILRIADWLYYDKRLPLLAMSYYRQVPTPFAQSRIGEIKQRMVLAIRQLLKES